MGIIEMGYSINRWFNNSKVWKVIVKMGILGNLVIIMTLRSQNIGDINLILNKITKKHHLIKLLLILHWTLINFLRVLPLITQVLKLTKVLQLLLVTMCHLNIKIVSVLGQEINRRLHKRHPINLLPQHMAVAKLQ